MVAANTYENDENGLWGWCIWNSVKETGYKFRSNHRETDTRSVLLRGDDLGDDFEMLMR